MTQLTNVTVGPKGVNLPDGSTLFIEPGQTVDVELSAAELASAQASGWFDEPKPEPKPKPEPGKADDGKK